MGGMVLYRQNTKYFKSYKKRGFNGETLNISIAECFHLLNIISFCNILLNFYDRGCVLRKINSLLEFIDMKKY